MDFEKAFSPQGYKVVLWKASCTLCCLVSVVYGSINAAGGSRYFFIYLSNLSVVMALAYMALSSSNSIHPVAIDIPVTVNEQRTEGNHVPSTRIRLTWVAFELATVMGWSATILYWLLIYDGDVPEFDTILKHGVDVFLVSIDGFVVNRIPFRLPHFLGFIVPVEILYLLWTVIYAFAGISNPDYLDDDTLTNNEVIYKVLDWKYDWGKSLILGCVCVFGLGGLICMIMWIISSRCLLPPYLAIAENDSSEIKEQNAEVEDRLDDGTS